MKQKRNYAGAYENALGIRQNHESNKLSKFDLILLCGVLVIYFFFVKTSNEIIDYPLLFPFCIGSVIFVVAFLFKIKDFAREVQSRVNLIDKSVMVALRMLSSAVMSCFFAGILLIPFNYYNINVSRSNPTETIVAPIESVYAHGGNDVVYYRFKGKIRALHGKVPIMNEIFERKDFSNYDLYLEVRKGLLSTYVLEYWNIVKRIQ